MIYMFKNIELVESKLVFGLIYSIDINKVKIVGMFILLQRVIFVDVYQYVYNRFYKFINLSFIY